MQHKRTAVGKSDWEGDPAPASQAPRDAPKRLAVVQQLAKETLEHIEQLIRHDPSVLLTQRSDLLPREVEDTQEYYLEKTRRVRTALEKLTEPFHSRSASPDGHELVRVELMILFVLIESCRPEQLVETSVVVDEDARDAIGATIQTLVLDIVNMRERLK